MSLYVISDRTRTGLRAAGLIAILMSVIGLVLGLLLVQSLSGDLKVSFEVSRSAVAAVGQTIDAVDEVAADATESIGAAAASLSEASTTVETAVEVLDNVSAFLETDLPGDIASVSAAMPAAIQAASAIDGTLGALSLLGVQYDPDQGLADSLRRVDDALEGLPGELREQSATLRRLSPSAEALAGETDQLSAALDGLEESLSGLEAITGSYQVTLDAAESAIEQTDSSLATKVWLLRLMLIALAIGGTVIGLALIVLGSAVTVVVEPEFENEPSQVSTG